MKEGLALTDAGATGSFQICIDNFLKRSRKKSRDQGSLGLYIGLATEL